MAAVVFGMSFGSYFELFCSQIFCFGTICYVPSVCYLIDILNEAQKTNPSGIVVFINTGIEYKATLKFVKQMAANDNRFVIWTVGKDIKKTLNKVGWPFKSKEHAQKLYEWKRGCRSKSHMRYFRKLPNGFSPCPQVLMYQIQDDFDMNISHFCCFCNRFLKKKAVGSFRCPTTFFEASSQS